MLFVWTRRGWLVVGPTAVLVAAAQPPCVAVHVAEGIGSTSPVQIIRVVGTFHRGGVDYATAVFTRLPSS